MLKDLLNLIYPNLCPGCEKELMEQEGAVCLTCLDDLEQTNYHLNPGSNELFQRFAGIVKVKFVAAHCFFDKGNRMQKIISGLKYQNQPQIGEYLGTVYGHHLQDCDWLSPDTTLIPVPLHPSREKDRGYNQAKFIASGLAKSLKINLDDQSLIRTSNTETQTGKGKERRWESMANAFQVKRTLPQKVVLVDDVITTGSTLIACIKTLQQSENPPKSVGILALGVTRKE